MDESRKKLLVDLVLGLVMVIVAVCLLDPFHAGSVRDVFRILSDCFFLPAVLLLGSAGLTWAKNGGVWDGLGFTMRNLIDRMKPNYEKERVTFAQYREKREEKMSSPVNSLIAGLVYLIPAAVFLVLFKVTG